MTACPKISVVTPSYNQAIYLEETIQSVLNQNYSNLEYIVIDGGSTDNSVEVIKKYEKYLTYWVSERDKGQTDAIAKGLMRTTGQFVSWLNSDDTYLPGCLDAVACAAEKDPDADVIYGDYIITDPHGKTLLKKREIRFDYDIMLYGVNMIGQPAAFFSRSTYNRLGGLDINLNYFMDVEFWLRIARSGGKFVHLKKFLATYRFHNESKTIRDFGISSKCLKESSHIVSTYCLDPRYAGYGTYGAHYRYKRFINRVRRQFLKLMYRKRIDLIPGQYFVWYFKHFRLPGHR
jgi:glycosyltransferase involved in cell wall biosynthesis